MIIVKGLLFGLICGAVIAGGIMAVIQMPEFSSDGYPALGPVEFKLFGRYTITATKRSEIALGYTLIAACCGAVAGTVLGAIAGVIMFLFAAKPR